MFKMFEREKTQSYRLDTSNANMSRIEPGSILYNGDDGARLATVGDTMTVENAGLFLVSNDYANNTSMTSIYGIADMKSAYIAALPITDLPITDMECIEYDFTDELAPGSLFAVLDGEIVPITDIIPAPILVIGVTENGSDRNGNVKITTYTQPYEIQPSLYLVDGDDAAMVEGAQTAAITLSLAGEFDSDEVEDETNWTISTDTGFNDKPTFTVVLDDDHTVTITFDAGSGKTISFTGDPITIDVLQAAVVNARDDVTGYEYTPGAVTDAIELSVSDDTLMLEGLASGLLEVTLSGAKFDPVNAIVPANWVFSDLENIASDGVDSIALSGDDQVATITFGSATDLKTGEITISAKSEAIVGMNEGATDPIDYELPQITITISSGYDAAYHDVGDTLKLVAGAYSEDYEVTEKLVGDDDVLVLNYVGTAGNVLDSTQTLLFAKSVAIASATGTLSTEVEERRLTLVGGYTGITTDMRAYVPWDDNGTPVVSVYNILSLHDTEGTTDYLVVELNDLILDNPDAADGAHTLISVSYNVDANYGRPFTLTV